MSALAWGVSYASSIFPEDTYVGLFLPAPGALALFVEPGLSAPGELMVIVGGSISTADCWV
jgi:hypothetical protein